MLRMILEELLKPVTCLLIAALTITGGSQKTCYSAPTEQLTLSISPLEADRDKNQFAIGEPVWLYLSLANQGEQDFIFWNNGQDAITFEVEPEFKGKIKILSRKLPIEKMYRKSVVKAGEQIRFTLLLNEFLQVAETGVVKLKCIMQLRDNDRKPKVLETIFSLDFTRKLSDEEVKQLVKRLDLELDSKSTPDRLKATRSIRAIDPVNAIPLLDKAVDDENETLQLAALNILLDLKSPEATAILEKAAKSPREAVQYTAMVEVERRKAAPK